MCSLVRRRTIISVHSCRSSDYWVWQQTRPRPWWCRSACVILNERLSHEVLKHCSLIQVLFHAHHRATSHPHMCRRLIYLLLSPRIVTRLQNIFNYKTRTVRGQCIYTGFRLQRLPPSATRVSRRAQHGGAGPLLALRAYSTAFCGPRCSAALVREYLSAND